MPQNDKIYDAIHDYMAESYKEQAADEGVEWNEKYDAFVKPHADSLYNQIIQTVDMYMSHFAEPFPTFKEE